MTTSELIQKHEGTKLFLYKDTAGITTIGTGHNIQQNGISRQVAELMLKEDIAIAQAALKDIFTNWEEIPTNAQLALTDMMFNLGEPRFLNFKKMIQAVKNGDYKEAAAQAKDSIWCEQVGQRCLDDCGLLGSA